MIGISLQTKICALLFDHWSNMRESTTDQS